jgi:hypothetical protein
MTHPAYPAILERLSQLEDDPYDITEHDLLAWGITAEMIPDLIETILDEKYYAEDESIRSPHLYAYIALGQLKTLESIDGLILGVKKWSHTGWFEWFCEGMPDIFESIGSIAIPALIPVLQDESLTADARASAAHYLYSISATAPEERDRCIAAIVEVLEKFEDNDPELNGYLVMYLIGDFKAVESAALLESVYASGQLDNAFMGDWEDAQVELGLIPERISPRSEYLIANRSGSEDENLQRVFDIQSKPIDSILETQRNQSKSTNTKNKAKRKQEKQSRKKNRRK